MAGPRSRGAAGVALGSGLFRIGEIAAKQQDDEETRQRQAELDKERLAAYAAERGGGLGATPMRAAVAPTPSSPAVEPFEAMGGGTLGSGLPAAPAMAGTPGTPGGPDPRYVGVGGDKTPAYVLRPEFRPEYTLAKGAQDRANAELAARTALWRDQATRERAQAAYDLARANRPAGAGGGRGGRLPTYQQAMADLRQRYGHWDDASKRMSFLDEAGQPVAFEQMDAEARDMAVGKAPRRSPVAPPSTTVTAPPAGADTGGGFHPLRWIGHIIAGDQGQSSPAPTVTAPAAAAPGPAAAAPSSRFPAPSTRLSLPAAEPTARPSPTSGGKTPVSQEEWDELGRQNPGIDLSQYYTVNRSP